jgi:hypothetical protein
LYFSLASRDFFNQPQGKTELKLLRIVCQARAALPPFLAMDGRQSRLPPRPQARYAG